MNIILIILLIFLVIATIAGCCAAITGINKSNNKLIDEKFRQSVNDVAREMSEQFDSFLKSQEESIHKELKETIDQFENYKQQIKVKIDLLDESEQQAKQRHEQKLKELEEKTAEIVNNRAKMEAAQVQSIIEYYQNQQNQIIQDFELFKIETKEKKEEILKQLKKEQQRQEEIIAQYKRAEQIKQDKNFYRIVLSKDVQEDVKKLRKIAEELHDPTIIYKLIYKTYYEKPFTEMVGRVVSTEAAGCGIYKITNLENGRSYIGQTKQAFKERWRTHLKRGVRAEPGTQNKLYSAMWEDGVENFTFEVLATCSPKELNQKEREYIAFYHADTWGYNETGGNIK